MVSIIRRLTAIAVLLAVSFVFVHAGEEAVLTLGVDSIDAAIAENEHIMVEFYAPWCGHCKKLAPEYEAAAQVLRDIDIPLAKVDCSADENRPICSRYEVRGFPTVKWFSNGVPSAYEDARTAAAIINFAKKRTGPASTELSAESVSEFTSSNALYVFGLFSAEDSADFTAFMQFAKDNRDDFVFAHTFDTATATSVSDSMKTSSIVLVADFASEPIAFEGEFSAESFKAFLSAESFPLVAEINGENFMKFIERGLPLVWLFVDPSEISESVDEWGSTLSSAMQVAAEFKGKVSIVYLDGEKFERHKEQMGHSGALPAIMLEDSAANKKYKFDVDTAVSAESIRAFLSAFSAGELEAFLKSEEIPENNQEPVTIVVGKNFDQVVGDVSKDRFVEYYAPWCGHCKKLAPIYEELGEAFQDDSNVVIAKVDATANDVPEDIKGFPTLLFYPAGSVSGVSYDGARELADMEAYIKENRVSQSAAAASGKDEL